MKVEIIDLSPTKNHELPYEPIEGPGLFYEPTTRHGESFPRMHHDLLEGIIKKLSP